MWFRRDHFVGLPAGTLENEFPGADVPEPNPIFDVGVVPATGDVHGIQRARPHQPHLAHPADEMLKILQTAADRFLVLEKSNPHNRLIQLRPRAYPDRLPVERGRFPPRGREHLIHLRRIHHTGDGLPVVGPHPLLRRDAHRVMRDVVEIVHRPIERINHPPHRRCCRPRFPFLAQNRVLGKIREDDAGNQRLRLLIQFEFDVVMAALIDVERRTKILPQQLTGSGRGFEGGFQHGAVVMIRRRQRKQINLSARKSPW